MDLVSLQSGRLSAVVNDLYDGQCYHDDVTQSVVTPGRGGSGTVCQGEAPQARS